LTPAYTVSTRKYTYRCSDANCN